MLKVILKEKEKQTIMLSNVTENTPIFAKHQGKLIGMIVFEVLRRGWILKIGGICGADGYYATREECIQSALNLGYKIFVEE
jgi:hypothetical protein